MAQRQFRSDDTSKWNDRYGNGSDGSYNPSTGTDAPIDSACTGSASSTSLSATNASFAAGQLILIHQTKGTGAGQWELNKISSYSTGTITTAYPLIYDYASGAQVVVMPQYSSGLIDTGVTITIKAWNGTVGGIYAKFCKGTFSIVNSLTGVGKGFRGGASSIGGTATQGEGKTGTGSANTSANGQGGGGGKGDVGNRSPGGGGGGYGTGGSNGESNNGNPGGTGGGTEGVAGLVTAFLGGGGGGGARGAGVSGTPSAGAAGGAFILIIAKVITVSGSIVNNGNTAGNKADGGGAGGSGSGGGTLLKGQIITLGTNLVTASGGTASTSPDGDGGAGGDGRIHADYGISISGTTTPTIDSRQDNVLKNIGGPKVIFF